MKLLHVLGLICIFLSVVSLQPLANEDENQRQWREYVLNNQRYQQQQDEQRQRQLDAMAPIIGPAFAG